MFPRRGLTRSLPGQFFPECHPRVWFSFAEVPAGCVLWCRGTAEIHVLNDEYTRQWHPTMHFNWRDNSSVAANVLMDSLHPRSTRASWWSPPVLQAVSSDIRATWPIKEKCRAGTKPKVWLFGCLSHIIIPHAVLSITSSAPFLLFLAKTILKHCFRQNRPKPKPCFLQNIINRHSTISSTTHHHIFVHYTSGKTQL